MITLTYTIPKNLSQKNSTQIAAFATAPINQGELAALDLTDVSDPPNANIVDGGTTLVRTVKLTQGPTFLANFPGTDNQEAAVANLFTGTIEMMLATKVTNTTVVVV